MLVRIPGLDLLGASLEFLDGLFVDAGGGGIGGIMKSNNSRSQEL